MPSFSQNGFTVTQTSTGVTITPSGGDPITVTIADYASMGIDFTDSDLAPSFIQF